jgi:tRNA (guanine37-N1)-methyltransferase
MIALVFIGEQSDTVEMAGARARCLRVPKGRAEETRRRLLELGLLRTDFLVARDGDSIYLPLADGIRGKDRKLVERLGDILERELEQSKRVPKTYRELLDLPPEMMELLPRAYDVVGKVIVLKIPQELSAHRAIIGEALLRTRPEALSVAWDRGVKGEDRIRDLEVIAGQATLETVHIENGLRFSVDPSRVYYSPRLATERSRIAGLVKKGEVVVDLFAGVGPFSITIAKRAQPSTVYAVDINPAAIEFMKRNLKLNHVAEGRLEAGKALRDGTVKVCGAPVGSGKGAGKAVGGREGASKAAGGPVVVPILGDARDMPNKLPKADRIIMNLPHSATEFMPVALGLVGPAGTIHLYDIIEPERSADRERELEKVILKAGKRAGGMACRRVRGYSSLESHFVFDIGLN